MENRNISAEIRPVEDRFLRLLEILAGPNKKDKALVLVSNQELCDNVFRDLVKVSFCPWHIPTPQSDRIEQSSMSYHWHAIASCVLA